MGCIGQNNKKEGNGEGTSEPGGPQKVHNGKLIYAIQQISISDSAAQERRQLTLDGQLDQLMEDLNHDGYNLKCTFKYLHFLLKNSRTVEGKKHFHTASLKVYKF